MGKATMVINNVEYNVPDLDINAVCDLYDLGIDIVNMNEDLGKNPFKMIRGIVAWVTKKNLNDAGKLLESHFINGGDFDNIIEGFTNAINESGFFKALQRREVVPTDHQKKTRKATAEKTA